MTSRKLRTFEEKVNGFLKYSIYAGSWYKPKYLKKYAYLSEAEIDELIAKCREIEYFAIDLAKQLSFNEQIWNSGRLTNEIKDYMEPLIRARYPYLEPMRVLSVIGLGWLYTVK